jgi:hypothetical protein
MTLCSRVKFSKWALTLQATNAVFLKADQDVDNCRECHLEGEPNPTDIQCKTNPLPLFLVKTY